MDITKKYKKETIVDEYKINFNENIMVENFDISVNNLKHQEKSDIDKLI